MPESQSLIEPHWVQLNSISKSGNKNKAFPFMVVHEGPSDSGSDQKWGWAYIADTDNTLGGPDGMNAGVHYFSDIGRGKPGENVSWSPLA